MTITVSPKCRPPAAVPSRVHIYVSNYMPVNHFGATQDVKEDMALAQAAVEVQRAWRGWASRKRARWVRIECEGRRRLSRLREEVHAERERVRELELTEEKAREER